jgi:hypothetical protein
MVVKLIHFFTVLFFLFVSLQNNVNASPKQSKKHRNKIKVSKTIAKNRRDRFVQQFSKLKTYQMSVGLDLLNSLSGSMSRTKGVVPSHSPLRGNVMKLCLRNAEHSTEVEQAKFFRVSVSTISRVHQIILETTQLANQSYPLNVRRNRSNPEREKLASNIQDELAPVQSGRKWRLCVYNDNQLYKLYKKRVQVCFLLLCL